MRTLGIVVLFSCAACTASFSEDSPAATNDAPPAAETYAAPVVEPTGPRGVSGVEEAEPGATRAEKWHQWFAVDIPNVADGILELNVSETSMRKVSDASLVLYDDMNRALEKGSKGWISATVAPGHRYYVEVEANPNLGDVRLISSYRPAYDNFEPNDDPKSAASLEAGKPTHVRLFAPRAKGMFDADYFKVNLAGARDVRVELANAATGEWACVDLFVNDKQVGSGCSQKDIDLSFELPRATYQAIVRLSGANRPTSSTLTITPQ